MFAAGGKKPILFSVGLFLVLILLYFLFSPNRFILPIIGIIQLLFILYFFRDPDREISEGISSPADGKVQSLDTEENTIEIFMNIWDVHVNRIPCSGKVKKVEHKKGEHSPAFFEKTDKNEQQLLVLSTEHSKMKIWQIAGMMARRIVPYVEEGNLVKKGEKLGMIRFGSKVKVKFAGEVEFTVEEGEKVKAGKTSLGEWNE
ncbi:MAG: phosphatidylserine decarboxylase [Candidatus Thermoplasmatota archaeon]